MSRPYIALGLGQQGRVTPTVLARLIEAERSLSLPDLLLKTGAMEGPDRRTRPVTCGLFRRWLHALLRVTA